MPSQNNPNPNENNEIFRFGCEEIQEGLERANMSVLIRIFWDQPRNRMFVQNSLNQLWHYDGSIQVLEVGFGLLQVVFPSVDAMNWVLERRPWTMNMNVMNMVPFSPPSMEIFNELQFMPVWIKLSRVPSHCITTRFGRGFLRYFGDVLDISLFGSRGRDAVFIKGLVRIDLLASFLGRRQACGPDNVLFWVRLHYENISSMCFRCGFLGHSSSRCPHLDIPFDLEVRGPWMSIGRVGFRILESSLQKYMLNQSKAKKSKEASTELGQFSFVTKEKRFGFSVQPKIRESGREDEEMETGQPEDGSGCRDNVLLIQEMRGEGNKANRRRVAAVSDGWMSAREKNPLPLKSAPTVLNNQNHKKTVEVPIKKPGIYIPPAKRRLGGKSSVGSSKIAGKGHSVHSKPPLRAAGTVYNLPTKRKLVFGNKGKEKMMVEARHIPRVPVENKRGTTHKHNP
ncbi:hypothetical protein LINPERHAP2_LOCUS26380 [Linum perenne]